MAAKASSKVTVEQIDALTDEQQRALLTRVPLELVQLRSIKDAILRAYRNAGMLDPADEIFASVFNGVSPTLHKAMLNTYRQDSWFSPTIPAAIRAFDAERRIVYMAMRLVVQLGSMAQNHNLARSDRNFALPRPRAVVFDSATNQLVSVGPDQVVMLPPWVTEEMKVQGGINLLADLALVCPPYTTSAVVDASFENGPMSIDAAWRQVLADTNHSIMKSAYVYTRAYFVHAKHVSGTEQLEYPGSVVPSTGKALVEVVAGSIHAHLQRGLINLPEPGRSYLNYVLRCLQNYVYYGVAGLRPSDLQEGDAVFSAVGGSIIPAIGKRGLPTASAMLGLIDSYLVKVPDDEVVIQRLLKL